MCLVVKKRERNKKEITVYKVMKMAVEFSGEISLLTPFQEKEMKMMSLYIASRYSSKDISVLKRIKYLFKKQKVDKGFFHSFLSLNDAEKTAKEMPFMDCLIIKAAIPAGSVVFSGDFYFIGEKYSSIASSTIVLIQPVFTDKNNRRAINLWNRYIRQEEECA